MRLNIPRTLILAAIVLLAAMPVPQATAADNRFEVDAHTLFLAHFDERADRADYANGWDEFAGSGWNHVPGYYGKAIDLRGLQFDRNFMKVRSSHLPYHYLFGWWERGNIDHRRGTFECWFKVAPGNQEQNSFGHSFFNFMPFRPFTGIFAGATTLNRYKISWNGWTFFDRTQAKGKHLFEKPLDPDEWHHYAMTWSIDGYLVIYIDGRPVECHDMRGQKGMVFHSRLHRPIVMNGVALDEMRISNVVRYDGPFEPRWRGGQRPEYAVEGNPDIQVPQVEEPEPYVPAVLPELRNTEPVSVEFDTADLVFDRRTGQLLEVRHQGKTAQAGTNGLIIWEGYERAFGGMPEIDLWEQDGSSLTFIQRYPNGLRVHHTLTEEEDALRWTMNFENTSDKQLLTEALLSLPLPVGKVDEIFDASWIQDKLSVPRRRFHYASTMPLVVAAGSDQVIGFGIEPDSERSDLFSEWIPNDQAGVLRQGTTVVLDPGQSEEVPFFVFTRSRILGAEDGLNAYYDLFDHLYRLDATGHSVYAFMPQSNYHIYINVPDLNRQCYIGNEWGHGPYHGKGDEWGKAEFWDRDDLAAKYPSYERNRKYEPLWQNDIDLLHAMYEFEPRTAYCYQYTLRRFHYLPNMPSRWIVYELWPEGVPEDDPMNSAQYYSQNYLVNEVNTPVGEHFKWSTRNIMNAASDWAPGFINDMCHTVHIRHIDPIARQSSRRGFSDDRGVYIRGVFGHAERFKMMKAHRNSQGYPMSCWADGGVASYILGAQAAQMAIESMTMDLWYSSIHTVHQSARYLLGEKGMTSHYYYRMENLGKHFKPAQFTPKKLRDYYRYFYAQEMLYQIEEGISVGSTALCGRQHSMQLNPILIESMLRGRQVHAGIEVDSPLWAVRGGRDIGSLVVIGNNQPEKIDTQAVAYDELFGGSPVFGRFFGGTLRQTSSHGRTRIHDVSVNPRDVMAMKQLARIKGGSEVTVQSEFSGDGISLQVALDVQTADEATLILNTFEPMYVLSRLVVDGESSEEQADPGRIELAPGKHRIEFTCRHESFGFTAQDWQAVDLLKDGQANFCIIGERRPGFAHGTAMMLNQFLVQYDLEDGVHGNLETVPVRSEAPAGFDGWCVTIAEPARDAQAGGMVDIDPQGRTITFSGQTLGDIRRAMVVFLRLVDRKYPHIGPQVPTMQKDPLEWITIDETKEFFKRFSDQQFLLKPILTEEYESLYKDDTLDFEGKYSLDWSPYIYEPTYEDRFLYGYDGPAVWERTEMLERHLQVRKGVISSPNHNIEVDRLD
jgi:hypothetical protein